MSSFIDCVRTPNQLDLGGNPSAFLSSSLSHPSSSLTLLGAVQSHNVPSATMNNWFAKLPSVSSSYLSSSSWPSSSFSDSPCKPYPHFSSALPSLGAGQDAGLASPVRTARSANHCGNTDILNPLLMTELDLMIHDLPPPLSTVWHSSENGSTNDSKSSNNAGSPTNNFSINHNSRTWNNGVIGRTGRVPGDSSGGENAELN